MTGEMDKKAERQSLSLRVLYWLAVAMVIVGLFNSTPGIPGYDNLVASITGQSGWKLRKFSFEWFYPVFFAVMMIIVALKHSIWRDWQDQSPAKRKFGIFLDFALVFMAITISLTYLIEIESICLIDQINGDRARLIADSLAAATAFNESLGLYVIESEEYLLSSICCRHRPNLFQHGNPCSLTKWHSLHMPLPYV